MARLSPTLADPSSDAAAVLRRLGFWLLFFATPLAALFARRAVVVVAPLAIGLLALAAALDGGSKLSGPRLRHILVSPGSVAGFLLLFWTVLSLVWTPFLPEASERLLNIVGMLLLAAIGYLALPDRMRSANLYILPVGVALTALAALGLALRPAPMSDPDGQSLERGLVVLVLFVWPAISWLHSRGRNMEALLLAVAVALASLVAPTPLPFQGLAVGALVFAVAAIAPKTGTVLTASVMAGLLLLAPLIPFVLKPLAAGFLGTPSALTAELEVWRSIVLGEPLRLVTGHGLETALRGRFVGLLPANAPSTILFEIWYELGLVGAAAGAVVLFAAVTGAVGERPPLIPGIMATFATAYAFGCLGIGTAQVWWFTALVIVGLIFVAIERGQFRTKRPKAILRTGR
nr:peptide ABC transporter permease [Microvirga pudoricolor]